MRAARAAMVIGLSVLLAACSVPVPPTATPVPPSSPTPTEMAPTATKEPPTATATSVPLTPTATVSMIVASSSSSEGGHVDRINDVPDVMQMDPAGDLPFGGSYSCAPVSAANYLVWLAENGYPDLAPPAGGEGQRVLDLARVLGSPRYMNAQGGGVSPIQYASALRQYVAENTDYDAQIDHWGWEHYAGDDFPELSWFTEALDGDGAVWLLVGSCEQPEEPGEHVCKKLHWVTLVGYGVDEAGAPDDHYLIIHCSAPQSGSDLRNEYVRTEELRDGTLRFPDAGIRTSAVGIYHMAEGMLWPAADEMPVISGAVRLKMREGTAGGS